MKGPAASIDGQVDILLCTPRPLLAAGMAMVVENSPYLTGLRVRATAATAESAIAALDDMSCRIVVVDERLPRFDEVITAAEKHGDAPDVVLVVADPADERVRRFLVHGVIGVVPDTVEPRQFVGTLLAVLDGQISIPARLATLCFEGEPAAPSLSVGMSAEDIQLLRLLVESRSTRDAARLFHVSEATIKKRLGRLFRRIGVSDRTQAAVWALRAGIVDQGVPAAPPPVVRLTEVMGKRQSDWRPQHSARAATGTSGR